MSSSAPPDVVLEVAGDPLLFVFWCQGCGYCHHISTGTRPPRWTFNGDKVRPTVSPSLLVNKTRAGDLPRCHLFIRDGQIQYLSDSTHELAGQTVDMIPPP